MDLIKLGKRIREERKKYHLTQEELSEKIDISDSYLGQIERGERGVTIQNLLKISQILGVSIDYLLSDSVDLERINDNLMNEIVQLIMHRTNEEKKLVHDLVKTLFNRLDKK